MTPMARTWQTPRSIIEADRILTEYAKKRRDRRALVNRVKNALRAEYGQNMDVNDIAALVSQCTKAEMLQVPNIGKKTLKLIEAWLAIRGLRLFT